MTTEYSREDDGRWIAEVTEVPGCMAYGDTQEEARVNVRKLLAQIAADEAGIKYISPEEVLKSSKIINDKYYDALRALV